MPTLGTAPAGGHQGTNKNKKSKTHRSNRNRIRWVLNFFLKDVFTVGATLTIILFRVQLTTGYSRGLNRSVSHRATAPPLAIPFSVNNGMALTAMNAVKNMGMVPGKITLILMHRE